ncbi:TolC family protein [Piscinibacter gummiphilus]|uniref:RND transporter n=1 Tax=Piscinibacter gummiphilus TaxID=946333 RepID=A0A1W6L9C8_9BURK|nr:TolC family protein [Piscinibacter gummiphilus]ARN20840.1 RND transporter [Piscinibacter gummiphilus]GLS94675.1 copper resistance-related lipoprotein [Piscinibacter gummiphilus]
MHNLSMVRRAVAASAVLVLAGCASFSPDGGAARVSELTAARTGHPVTLQRTEADVDTATRRVAELLKQPLTPDSAVEVALLNHRGLQAAFAELGIAEADRVRAGRLANPTFTFGRLSGGGVTEIDRTVMFNVLGLLTLPLANDVAQRQLAQVQVRAASDAVGAAAEARKAFFGAIAAQDLARYHEQVKDAADTSSELARRMQAAGNFSKLARLREQSFQVDATANLARARHRAVAERERLVRALGLSGDQLAFTLPARLPDLPAAPLDARNAEQTAIDQRLDVLMARREAEATAKSLGLTRGTRFVNVLEAGYANKSQTGEPRQNGFEIELELPLFDFGATRTARAEATYMQAVHRTAEVAANAQSEVRETYSAYRTAYDLAKHYRDEAVPLRQRISEENLLRYNGMLASVFELLADARDQVGTVTAAIEALRDHWIAETDLRTAMTGRSPGASPAMAPTRDAAAGQGGH